MDHDEHNEESGHKSEAAEAAASSLGRVVKSNDGRVLGMKMPEPFPSLWDVFSGRALQALSDGGGKTAGKLVAKATHSEAAGKATENAITYGIPHIPQAVQLGGIARRHKENRSIVLEPLAPLLAANKGSAGKHFDSGYSGNKMVEYALGKVTADTYQGLKGVAVDSTTAIVNNATSYLKRAENPSEKGQKALGFINNGWGNDLVGTARLGIKKTIKNIDVEQVVGETSLGKVRDLAEDIRVDLGSSHGAASASAVQAVAEKVENIFETYQKEQGHKHIPTHRMREVSTMLAEQLVSGDLHALSLVNIIGKEQLLTDKKDGFVSSEKIAGVVKKELEIFSKDSAITSQDFLDGKSFSLDDIKTHLQSKDKDERALVAILVPESVALEAGAKKEELKDYREHISAKLQEGIFAAVVNGLATQSDEQLSKKGLSDEAIAFVRDHQEQGAESIGHALHRRTGKDHLEEIAGAALIGEDSGKWRTIITEGRSLAAGKPAANDDQYLLAANGTKGRSPLDYTARDSDTTLQK